MTNHPNRRRFSADEIRDYLMETAGAEDVLRGVEMAEREIEGRDDYGYDEWHVYGTMPNTNQIGWWYAGHTADVVREMRETGRE